MWKKTILTLMTLMLATTIASAGDDAKWLHVAVDSEDAEHVRVNLPLTLVSAILPLIEEEQFSHGRILLDGEEFDRADVVAMLQAVSKAEDGEYVTVDDQDDHVRISKKGDSILVRVEERDRRSNEIETRVNVTIPVAVLDALASGDKDELDVMAALEVLADQPMEGDLVTVNDDESTVRIWVDRRNQSD